VESAIEAARRAAPKCLPKGARDAGWHTVNFLASVRGLGIRDGVRMLRTAANPAPDRTSEFSVYGRPFHVRHGGSDTTVLIQSVFRSAYGPWLPADLEPSWVLDLGANIGDSAVWFLERYPGARVVSVEPEPANYGLLRRNVATYGDRAIVLQAALWPDDGSVRVRVAPELPAGSEVGTTKGVACAAISVPTLMARYGITHIDIFKCDIEGTEEAIFRGDTSWLAAVDHMCIELHDENCRAVVRAAAARHGFTERRFREIHVFRRTWPA
jgi:FkbM family methyltransferase